MRRIGSTPAERGSTGYNNCPDVIELDDGDFFVIGARALVEIPHHAALVAVGVGVNQSTETAVRAVHWSPATAGSPPHDVGPAQPRAAARWGGRV
jgi:hypothetical protein